MSALIGLIVFAQTATPSAAAAAVPAIVDQSSTPTPTPPLHVVVDQSFWASPGAVGLFVVVAVILGGIIGVAWKGGQDNWLAKLFSDFTNALAYFVILLAFAGILGLSWVVLSAKKDLETAKYVFAAVLPLLGTWVGTVLAHYFQKENLNAATQSITTLVSKVTGNEKLQSIPVKNVMIRPDKIETLPDPLLNKDDKDISLSELTKHLREGTKRDRLPIFKHNQKTGPAERVLHRSIVEKFIAQKAVENPPTKPIDQLTLEDLMNDRTLGAVVRGSFGLVKADGTLADAKSEMDKASAALGSAGNCYDVFVTDTGKPDEIVIGWITNDIINENAKV
jgi:hypothetical protein